MSPPDLDVLPGRTCARRDRPAPLATVREREVLALVGEGAGTAEIARTLAISPATVETLIANAVRRLGARNRRHAATLLAPRPAPAVALEHDEHLLVAALAGGASMAEAAARAGLSLRTAHRRMAGLRTRLGARSTTQAVALAR